MPVNVAAVSATARPGMVRFARVLAITVACLLLIGSVTVGALLLLQIEARRSEFATCLALGATIPKLAQSVGLEALIVSIIGAGLAMPVASGLLVSLRTFQLPGNISIEHLDLGIDQPLLVAAIGCATAWLIILMVLTRLLGVSVGIAKAIMLHSGSGARVSDRRTRRMLVTGQVGVAMVLLTGAMLFVRSLQAAIHLNPQVDMEHVLTGSLSLQNRTDASATVLFDELIARLRENPAIASVAQSIEQGGMGPQGKIIVDGEPQSFPSKVSFTAIDSQYFSTLGLAPTSGRQDFDSSAATGSVVAVVSESFARMLPNGVGAVGRRIALPHGPAGQPRIVVTVVGVVPDVITDVNVHEPLTIYLPLDRRLSEHSRSITVRAKTDPSAVRREVIAAVRQLDPETVPGPLLTLRQGIERQMGPQLLGSAVLGSLGVVALLLTVLGTYVVADSAATLRLRELGIRAALGATRFELSALLLYEMTRLVAAGLVLGLGAIWLGASTIRALLFRIEPVDFVSLIVVAGVILTLALGATIAPAMRASRIDPARVLRSE
jgi:predicted permease